MMKMITFTNDLEDPNRKNKKTTIIKNIFLNTWKAERIS